LTPVFAVLSLILTTVDIIFYRQYTPHPFNSGQEDTVTHFCTLTLL